ncbi:MAG: hypothetical protein MHMPM18_000695 [Marteilia pararefringens]
MAPSVLTAEVNSVTEGCDIKADISQSKVQKLEHKESEDTIRIKFTPSSDLGSSYKLPSKATPSSVGYDVYAHQDIQVRRLDGDGRVTEIPLGFSAHICDSPCQPATPQFYMRIVARSSLARKGLHILDDVLEFPEQSEGVSEGSVPFTISVVDLANDDIVIKKGERFAQLILHRAAAIEWIESEQLEKTERGEGGYGSSGA